MLHSRSRNILSVRLTRQLHLQTVVNLHDNAAGASLTWVAALRHAHRLVDGCDHGTDGNLRAGRREVRVPPGYFVEGDKWQRRWFQYVRENSTAIDFTLGSGGDSKASPTQGNELYRRFPNFTHRPHLV